MASVKFLESPTGVKALRDLGEICKYAHSLFTDKLVHLELSKDSAPVSPIKHLYARESEDPEEFLRSVIKMVS